MKPFLLTLVTISFVFMISFAHAHAQDNASDAKLISSPTPEYPKDAKDAGFGGTVRIKVEVDKDGNVVSSEPSA